MQTKNLQLLGNIPKTAEDVGADVAGSAAQALSDAKTYVNQQITGHTHAYIPTSEKGTASGVASLGTDGKVPAAQLPSYVDDVIEGYYLESEFYEDSAKIKKITPESSKIYIDLSSNKTYRYSGSAYVEISQSLALGETASTAFAGDRGKTAYDHSQVASGNPHKVTKGDVGLGNVENKSSAAIREELTKDNITSALGYTPPEADTHLPLANNLTTATAGSALDATQGKALNDSKVDKVSGKGLSTNDFTNEEKAKLANAITTIDADDKYLQLTGGTMTGDIGIYSYDGAIIGQRASDNSTYTGIRIRTYGGAYVNGSFAPEDISICASSSLNFYAHRDYNRSCKTLYMCDKNITPNDQNSWQIKGLKTPTEGYDAANKQYVDSEVSKKQDKLIGTEDQIVGFDADGNAVAQDKPSYTASDIGARPDTWTPSKADIGLGNVENKSSATIRSELTKNDVTTALGYIPPKEDTKVTIVNNLTTTTAGNALDATQGKALNDSKVPNTRKVNGKALSSDITLSASDINAAASSHNQAASTITAGTFAGQVAANSSGQATGSFLLRNCKVSATEENPTVNGEIVWVRG